MKSNIVVAVVAVFCCFLTHPLFAADQTSSQYLDGVRSSATLSEWSRAERERLTPQNNGYRMAGPTSICEAMKSVSLGCSYNERSDLVVYLLAHGVNLFPCKDGTNPYTQGKCSGVDTDIYNYIGQPLQNSILAKSIVRNRELFSAGDLTASAARKWRN